ncbi:GNAT family N-acetyltransferase [Candidatus Peregrinibacteria bacterium]|nr:GNAT family N-acetyltransferase [Candidatus Peregrinibacteria bacterium]
MPLDDIEIIGGNETKNHLQAGELEKLVALWMKETYQPVDVPISRTRVLVESVLKDLPMGNKLISILSDVRERLRDRFPQFSKTRQFQAEQKEQSRASLIQHLQKAIDRGDMTIARKEGKAIGMVRVHKLDAVGSNQFIDGDVYEIGKALIVPEERGNGIYRALRKQAIANLRKKYGDVSILAGTKIEAIKKLNREDGWTEIGFDNYLRIHGTPEAYIDSRKENIQRKGGTAFLYIPSKEI